MSTNRQRAGLVGYERIIQALSISAPPERDQPSRRQQQRADG